MIGAGAMHSELSVSFGNAGSWLTEHLRQLATHDLHPVVRSESHAVFETAFGRVQLDAEANQLRVRLDSLDTNGLATLQEFVSGYLIATDAGLSARICWEGSAPTPGKPKTFREMTVLGTRALSDWMLRMTLKGSDLTPFGERGLHVRLMIPRTAAGDRIVWPTIERSGSVRYPDGADELIVRVYTIRRISPASGEVEIDIVRHTGGAFSDWSETARPGERVGMIGPGGGYFPAAGWLGIGGDDTALPAISRILEARCDSAGGKVTIGLRPHQTPCDLTVPDQFSVDWVPLKDLPRAMKAAAPPPGANQVAWFAGEAEQASEMREHFKSTLGLPPALRSSAAYWRRDAAAPSH